MQRCGAELGWAVDIAVGQTTPRLRVTKHPFPISSHITVGRQGSAGWFFCPSVLASVLHSQSGGGRSWGPQGRAGLELQNGGFTPVSGALVFFQGGLSLRMCLTLQGLSTWPFSLAGSLESFPGGWLPGMQSANCQASLRFGLTTSTSLLAHFIGTVSHRTRPDSVWEGGACRCGYRCGYRCIEGRFADWQLQRGRESPAGDSDPLERKQR